MEKNHLTVTILGVSLTLKSKETPEYLKEIIHYFQGKIDKAKENLMTVDPSSTKLRPDSNSQRCSSTKLMPDSNSQRCSSTKLRPDSNSQRCSSTKLRPDSSCSRCLKILIMAGLNITEEFLKERNSRMKYIESEVDPEELENFTARMINKIDESLMEH